MGRTTFSSIRVTLPLRLVPLLVGRRHSSLVLPVCWGAVILIYMLKAREGPFPQRSGLSVLPLLLIEFRQVVEAESRVEMLRSQLLLSDRQRSLQTVRPARTGPGNGRSTLGC